jgi:hypothetical protein
MPDINASFKSAYSESRHWSIWDTGRDPNTPLQIFDGYLEPNQATDLLPVYSSDGTYGTIAYQRSDGPMQVQVSVTDGGETSMS